MVERFNHEEKALAMNNRLFSGQTNIISNVQRTPHGFNHVYTNTPILIVTIHLIAGLRNCIKQ